MAAPTKKKVFVNKDDLKRLMKEKKTIIQSKHKKIDSPLAKYDSLGQLHCVLCGSKVKNELLWAAHISGRTHKENVLHLKEQQMKKNEATVRPPEPPVGGKRKDRQDIVHSQKKIQKTHSHSGSHSNDSSLAAGFFEDNKSSIKSALNLGSYADSEEESDDEGTLPAVSSSQTAATASGLPSDFFDSGVIPSHPVKTEDAEEPSTSKTMAEKLPEGFFDDAKEDAKVRQVEYKDKMEEEWEMFQKAMKEEHQVSEALQEEDDETVQVERNIAEIDQQMFHWSKVEELHQMKEEVMTKTDQNADDTDSSNSDADEQEYEEFLDWRSKQVR